jgi:hypothetical protein
MDMSRGHAVRSVSSSLYVRRWRGFNVRMRGKTTVTNKHYVLEKYVAYITFLYFSKDFTVFLYTVLVACPVGSAVLLWGSLKHEVSKKSEQFLSVVKKEKN